MEHGLDAITTEMIAAEAGISLRSFFNYFSYKEEALLPPPIGFPPEAAERFVRGRGPLVDDLLALVASRMAQTPPERAHIRAVLEMSRDHPRLLAVREGIFESYEAEFRRLLARRLDLPEDDPRPELIAALLSAVFRVAMRRWACGEQGGDDSEAGLLAVLRGTLCEMAGLRDLLDGASPGGLPARGESGAG